LNAPKVENYQHNRLFGSHPFHTYTGTCAIFLILLAISVTG
jgi:hypothetical protein